MIHPLRFLLGSVRLRFSAKAAGEVLNLCQAHGWFYRDFFFCDEYACLICSRRTGAMLAQACRERGIATVWEREWGVPRLFARYRYRFGLWVGALIFCLVVFLSGQVIWDVRVEGNRALTDTQVIEELRACGFGVGSLKRGLDVDGLESRVLVYSEEISWISVNIIGTVANVELREREPLPEESPEYAAANLVAARGGIIEELEDVRGNVAVNIGDAVGEGDLLVGGIFGAEGKYPHYTCAKGRVIARTEHVFSVEIPLEYEKKVYTGRVREEKYLIFFEKEVKFFANTGNLPPTCDTINTVAYFSAQNGDRLPFGVRTVRYYEYEWVRTTRSTEEAKELAAYTLRCQMESEIPQAELVKKEQWMEQSPKSVLLGCRVECLENIARVEEIPLVGLERRAWNQNDEEGSA